MNAAEYVKWFHSKFINRYGKQWSNMLKDQEALIWLINQFNISSVFEIGMWEGHTALLFWLHPNIDYVKTIDICKEYGHPYHKPKDTYGIYLEYTNVIRETISSLDYIPKENEQYDMVFVEGNHEYEFVKSDFALALKFNPKIVAFHDYQNGNPGVDKFIDEIKSTIPIQIYPESAVVYYHVVK